MELNENKEGVVFGDLCYYGVGGGVGGLCVQ